MHLRQWKHILCHMGSQCTGPGFPNPHDMPKWFHQTALTHTLLSPSISFPFNSASFLRYFFCFLSSSPLVFQNKCSIIHNFYFTATKKSIFCASSRTQVLLGIQARASLPFQNLSRQTNQMLRKVHFSSFQIFHNMLKEKSLYSSSRETRGKKTEMLSVKCVN